GAGARPDLADLRVHRAGVKRARRRGRPGGRAFRPGVPAGPGREFLEAAAAAEIPRLPAPLQHVLCRRGVHRHSAHRIQRHFRSVRLLCMKPTLKKDLSSNRTLTVDEARCISFMGREGMVYATPRMVSDVEYTCRDFLLQHLDE